MPIGHNSVTWIYLVAKDAGKCSHYPRWSMSIDKGENRHWGTISWLKGLQRLPIILRMKFKRAPCHGLQNSARSGPCRLLCLTLFYCGTPAFSNSSPPAGFYSVSFCLEHFSVPLCLVNHLLSFRSHFILTPQLRSDPLFVLHLLSI